MRYRADAANARHQCGHLRERSPFTDLLESADLRYMKMSINDVAALVGLQRDLRVPFDSGDWLDCECRHDFSYAPNRAPATNSGTRPCNSSDTALKMTSAEGGHPGTNTSTFTSSWIGRTFFKS